MGTSVPTARHCCGGRSKGACRHNLNRPLLATGHSMSSTFGGMRVLQVSHSLVRDPERAIQPAVHYFYFYFHFYKKRDSYAYLLLLLLLLLADADCHWLLQQLRSPSQAHSLVPALCLPSIISMAPSGGKAEQESRALVPIYDEHPVSCGAYGSTLSSLASGRPAKFPTPSMTVL